MTREFYGLEFEDPRPWEGNVKREIASTAAVLALVCGALAVGGGTGPRFAARSGAHLVQASSGYAVSE